MEELIVDFGVHKVDRLKGSCMLAKSRFPISLFLLSNLMNYAANGRAGVWGVTDYRGR